MRVVAFGADTFAVLGATGGALTPQGPAAREIATLWWLMFWLGVAVFVVVVVLLVAALLRGRRRVKETGGDEVTNEDVPTSTRRRWLVLGGVVMPAIVLVVVLVATVETMADLPPGGASDALQIEVVGHQWWWEISYPDTGVTTANEIHIPVGQPVEFTLTSADVIHSFWVPELGGKLDLLPEDINVLVLEADEPAVYRSQCAEFCGLQHANMRLIVVAEPAEQFDTWLQAQAQPAADPTDQTAAAGQEVFLEASCVKCHAIRGTNEQAAGGPDLTHFAGRTVLTAAHLPDTRQQLSDWLADPQHFKEGTSMPPADLSEEDLEALVTYLESLQ